jgi:signal transduction histidine kinase
MSSISISPGRAPGRMTAGPGDLGSTLVLALGTFAVSADAFIIAGFLPSIADTLHVSTADGRQSVTAFVVAYAILAPLLAATTARLPRRVLLISALLMLGMANLVSALAPSLPILIAGRLLAAAGAATYTPIAASVCAALIRPRSRAPALAVIIGGMAAATTFGLTLGELAGRWLGWRAALGTVAAFCVLTGIGVVLTLPWLPGRPRPIPTRTPGLRVVLPITMLALATAYGTYAYGIPALRAIGIPNAAAVLLLFVYGLGAIFANGVNGLRRAGEERRRIARELHDSLTHNISLIKVQAGIAIHMARERGEPVPAGLLAIEEASGEAMRELRATLEVLRDPDGAAAFNGLGNLSTLVGRVRAAGLETNVTISGERRVLPTEVDRTAYRIVQEALTNVARHAGGASALVRISYRPRSLTVQIDDDGCATPGGAAPAPGIGLTGMRERVTALSGRLHAGPRPEGGFTVRAEIPLREAHPWTPTVHAEPAPLHGHAG